jgi:hypothetical protein
MSDFKRFSYQEFFVGTAATISSVLFLGWKGIPLALACGLLWMLGGTYLKTIRREGVNGAVFLYACWFHGFQPFYLVGLGLGIAILHIGDGFPDRRPTTADPGSWLGRQVEKWVPNPEVGGPITKWLIALIFQNAMLFYMVKV